MSRRERIARRLVAARGAAGAHARRATKQE
jgi:hypothetical protein